MLTADNVFDHVRPIAAALVKREAFSAGSKMAAYANVARRIGASASWLRKFVGRQPGMEIHAHQYLNLMSLYRRACERVEAEAELERQRLVALRGTIDETFDCDPDMVAPPPQAPRFAGHAPAPSQGGAA